MAVFQRIIDLAPASDTAEQALFTILQDQYNQNAFNSILTSYQYIFRHLPPSKSKWRSLSYLYAAGAYFALNQIDEAKVIYEMILKVYPNGPAAKTAESPWPGSIQVAHPRASLSKTSINSKPSGPHCVRTSRRAEYGTA